jgi:ABC-type multidrug transport system fused ATPase/permease subunit
LHILTKFFVFIAAILSVLLAGLSIAYTFNANEIATQMQRAKAQANAAVAEANASLATSEQRVSELRSSARDQDASLAERDNRIVELENSVSNLTAENAGLRAEQATYSTRIDEFTTLIATAQSLDAARADELRELRDELLSYARREIDLSDRINDLVSQLEVSQATVRSLQETIVQIQEGGDERGGDSGRTPVAPDGFRARVTDVRTEGSGRTLVAIDAGSSDGLRSGTRLSVSDEDGFSAVIVIEQVNLNSSSGYVDTRSSTDRAPSTGSIVVPAVTY